MKEPDDLIPLVVGSRLGPQTAPAARRLTGVIDWSALGVGDPACDMIVAWGLLPPAARDSFRAALGVDDATWARGRGWALSFSLIALALLQGGARRAPRA